MKKLSKPAYLSPAYLLLGAVGMVLYWWLFTKIEDEISLLLPALTLPEILLWVLTAVAIVAAFPLTRGTKIGFRSRLLQIAGALIFAVGTASLLTKELTGPAILVGLYRVVAAVGAVGLVIGAVANIRGKEIPFLVEVSTCLVALLQLLECYQLWSEVPQLMNYVMALGAVLCLTMACFFRVSRAAKLPGKSWHNAIGLLGIYFCAAATAQSSFSLYFCTASVWLACEYAGLLPMEQGDAA